jgi:Cu+-exporting ATPase
MVEPVTGKSSKSEQSSGSQAITIPVLGMSCAACQSHVERALRQTAGVGKAEVNLMTNTARVVFDPGMATPAKLVEAVRSSGYESSLPSANDMASSHGHDGHEHGSGASEAGLRVRALVTLSLAAVTMLLSMPLMQGMREHSRFFAWLPMQLTLILNRTPVRMLEFGLLALTLTGMCLAAGEVYKPAWKALLHRTTNMNTLVALGTIAALLYSAVATLAPQLFTSHGLRPEVYYESVLFILAFLMLGRWLEARAKTRTQGALQAFLQMQAADGASDPQRP